MATRLFPVYVRVCWGGTSSWFEAEAATVPVVYGKGQTADDAMKDASERIGEMLRACRAGGAEPLSPAEKMPKGAVLRWVPVAV